MGTVVDSIVVTVLMAPVVDSGRCGTVDMVSSVWSRVDTVVPPAGSVGVVVLVTLVVDSICTMMW